MDAKSGMDQQKVIFLLKQTQNLTKLKISLVALGSCFKLIEAFLALVGIFDQGELYFVFFQNKNLRCSSY